jgi:hypothetical protein
VATAVPTNADRSVHNTARAARTIAVYIHGSTEPPLYAKPALACAPACATRARTVSRNCRNTESEVRAAAAHSRRRRQQQPRASDAHPCTALCPRRRASTVQPGSRTGFTLPLVLHQPRHTVRQQPARSMTSDGQNVCTSLLPSRCTGVRSQDNSPSFAVRPTDPQAYAQPARQSAHRGAQLPTVTQLPQCLTGTRSWTGTSTASTWLHTPRRNSAHNCSVVLEQKRSDVWGNWTTRH